MSSSRQHALQDYDGKTGVVEDVYVMADGRTRAVLNFQGALGKSGFEVPANCKPGDTLLVNVRKGGLFRRPELSVQRLDTSPMEPLHGSIERLVPARGKQKAQIDVKIDDDYSIRVPLSSASVLEPKVGSPAMVVKVGGFMSGTVLASSPQPEKPERTVSSWRSARPSNAAVKKVQDEIARQMVVPAVTPTPAMSQREKGEAVSRKKGSPLESRGRFSDMSAYTGRTGVVQFIHVDNGTAYASVKFDRSIEGVNDVKLIPLSAFPNAYVQTQDHVTVYVGDDRNGDRRSLPRRVFEGIGLLKQSTKVEAIIQAKVVSYASAQDPDRDTVVDRAVSVRGSDRGIATRIADGLERIGSRVTAGVPALSQAVAALRNSLRPASASAELAGEAHTAKSATKVAREDGVAVDASHVAQAQQASSPFTEISASEVARLQEQGVVAAVPDQRHFTVEPSKLGRSQPIRYEVAFSETQRAVRIPAQASITQPTKHAVSPETWIAPSPQRAVHVTPAPKLHEATIRDVPLKQRAETGLWAAQANKDITPQARAQASLSRREVRAIALERARKHAAARGKEMAQDKHR